MTPEQSKKYVKHRLTELGWADTLSISAEAFQTIYYYTSGIRKEIGQLCDRLLPFNRQNQNHQITRQTVKLAIRELSMGEETTKQKKALTSGMDARKIMCIEQLAAALEAKVHSAKRSAEIHEVETSIAALAGQAYALLSEPQDPDGEGQRTKGNLNIPKAQVVDNSSTAQTVIGKALENEFGFKSRRARREPRSPTRGNLEIPGDGWRSLAHRILDRHSSIKITIDIYGHLMRSTNNEAAEKLAKLALSGSKSKTKTEGGS